MVQLHKVLSKPKDPCWSIIQLLKKTQHGHTTWMSLDRMVAVREARHRGINTRGFHPHEASRAGESRHRKRESGRQAGEGGRGGTASGGGLSRRGEGCMTRSTYGMSLNCSL